MFEPTVANFYRQAWIFRVCIWMSEIFKGGDSNDNVIILLPVYLTDQHVFFYIMYYQYKC